MVKRSWNIRRLQARSQSYIIIIGTEFTEQEIKTMWKQGTSISSHRKSLQVLYVTISVCYVTESVCYVTCFVHDVTLPWSSSWRPKLQLGERKIGDRGVRFRPQVGHTGQIHKKCTVICKSPGFVPCEANLTHFRSKFDMPDKWECVLTGVTMATKV